MHVYPFSTSRHVAPCRHGDEQHSSISEKVGNNFDLNSLLMRVLYRMMTVTLI